ncbi:uncharacterized protein LOC107044267 [Diachasma alloeum]|uniref:uncharacterized protein LOC107044267 n=1 Tax=Diachasma alloeum TaxID=454923 RepID=UPI00073817F0|nr:uncharacterized protein LOC107044267 [Diachasma alloeum]
MVSGGRPKHNFWAEGDFERLEGYRSKCKVCGKTWESTAQERLKAHRKKCSADGYLDTLESSTTGLRTSEHQKGPDDPEHHIPLDNVPQTASGLPATTSIHTSSPSSALPNRKRKMGNYIDSITEKQQKDIDLALARLIYAEGLSFQIVESSYSKALTSKMRPSYVPPSIEALATDILQIVHDSVGKDQKQLVSSDCIFILSNVKLDPEPFGQFAGIIVTHENKTMFLKTWDIQGGQQFQSLETQIIAEAIELAREKHNMEIYAVVLGSKAMDSSVEKEPQIWYFIETGAWIELLAQSLDHTHQCSQLKKVVAELNQQFIQDDIVDRGGTVLPSLRGDFTNSWQ